MNDPRSKKIPPAKEAAYIALTCALLIGGQYVFSFVVGVEIVTLILVSFSCSFGARRGIICALAFSLLRCIIFPFSPTALILYIIYYPALAAVFGGLGHIKKDGWAGTPVAVAVNLLLIAVCTACALCYALDLIKISRIYKVTIEVLLWVVFSLSALGCILFNILFILNKAGRNTAELLRIISLTSVAAVCTVCFTLLDDIITPLFYGYPPETALAYFYASFTAMLPQTVCTIVTVSTLFLPVTRLIEKYALPH